MFNIKQLTMVPKGRLVIIGNTNNGEETISKDDSLSAEIIDCLAKEKNDRIEIIASGSSISSLQEKWRNSLLNFGFSNFDFLNIDESKALDENYLLNRLSSAKTILFVGDHSRTYDILKKSEILRFLYKKYLFDSSFTVAAKTMGATCVPGVIIDESKNEGIKLAPGLGFLNNCIIDTEYVQQTKFEKLAYAILKNRDFIGLGLGENTLLIVENGCMATCKGSGTAMVINAKNVDQSNADLVKEGGSIYVKNMKGRILRDGCRINLNTGEAC